MSRGMLRRTVAFAYLKEWPSTFSTPVPKVRRSSWKSRKSRGPFILRCDPRLWWSKRDWDAATAKGSPRTGLCMISTRSSF